MTICIADFLMYTQNVGTAARVTIHNESQFAAKLTLHHDYLYSGLFDLHK